MRSRFWNTENNFRIVAYDKKDYLELIEALTRNSISEGASYDSLIPSAAKKIKFDKIITLNTNDLIRISPELMDKISTP